MALYCIFDHEAHMAKVPLQLLLKVQCHKWIWPFRETVSAYFHGN